jgi:protein SCO1/2
MDRHRWAPLAALSLCLAASISSCADRAPRWHGTTYENPPTASRLQGEVTQGVSAGAILEQGVPVVLFFGYTHCQDECPATLGTLASVAKGLGPAADDLRFVFITVDPERDDLQTLTDYLAQFNPAFIGVRPEAADLLNLLAAYGATAFPQATDAASEAHDDGIAHTTRIFLVDRAGRLRAHYPYETAPADLAADLHALLTSGG